MESFNGFGYRRHGLASPYLWSGTSLYLRGKYVSDGRFDPLALDGQLGCCAILKRMLSRGLSL
jgi:lysozyme family protein